MAITTETADQTSIERCGIFVFTEPNTGKSLNEARTSGQFGRVSGDQFGGIYVTQFAAIKSHAVTLGNTNAAYSVGHCLGTLESCDSVNRGNGFGAVIEGVRLVYTGNVAAASLPDIDIWIFSRASGFPGSSTMANRGYPSIDALDVPYIAGSIPIRVAAGHWRQFLSAAGTVQHSVATVNPYLSFNTDNDTDGSTDIGVLAITQTAMTPAAANAFNLILTIRKG